MTTVIPFKGKSMERCVQTCAILFLLMRQVRRQGLMSIESDVEFPEQSKILSLYQFNKKNEVLCTFICDTLRLMIGGVFGEEIEIYTQLALNSTLIHESDRPLFQVAQTMLVSASRGAAPQVCAEFGRQSFPAEKKISFNELEDILRELPREIESENIQDTNQLIDAFFDSIADESDEH